MELAVGFVLVRADLRQHLRWTLAEMAMVNHLLRAMFGAIPADTVSCVASKTSCRILDTQSPGSRELSKQYSVMSR